MAAAFNTESMSGVELRRIEYRSELCKVVDKESLVYIEIPGKA